MAHATSKTIKVPVTVYEDKQEIHLVLSPDEAETLLAICHRIGGNPLTTRRAHMDLIRQALSDVGVVPASLNFVGNREVLYIDEDTKEVKND